MHLEIENIFNDLDPEYPVPASVMLQNAERILNYMDDIYLERTGRFEYTAAESLYIMWKLDGLEFHIECLKNGLILYTFRKSASGKAFGADTIDRFMLKLQDYLLAGIC